MPGFLYVLPLLLWESPLVALPVVFLVIAAFIRTAMLIKKKHSSRESAGKLENAAIVLYILLDAVLLLPVILLIIYADIRMGFDHHFTIIKEWYKLYPLQGIVVMILSLVMSLRTIRQRKLIFWISLCVYLTGELLLTYISPRLFLQSVLIAVGGTAFSVCIGYIIGILVSSHIKLNNRT